MPDESLDENTRGRLLAARLLMDSDRRMEGYIRQLEAAGVPLALARRVVARAYSIGWRDGVLICEADPPYGPDMISVMDPNSSAIPRSKP